MPAGCSIELRLPLTLASAAAANARQISAVPLCTLVRVTSVQVRPAPVTLFTVVFVPVVGASAETKASSSSLAEVVENVAVAMVVALERVVFENNRIRGQRARSHHGGGEIDIATLAPFTVTAWLVGVNVNPVLVGVTV